MPVQHSSDSVTGGFVGSSVAIELGFVTGPVSEERGQNNIGYSDQLVKKVIQIGQELTEIQLFEVRQLHRGLSHSVLV